MSIVRNNKEINIFDPANITELRVRFQTCPRRITSEDYKFLIDFIEKLTDGVKVAGENLFDYRYLYFGINASQDIADIYVLDHVMMDVLPFATGLRIDGTVTNPIYGYIYLVLPTMYSHKIACNGQDIKNDFTLIKTITSPDRMIPLNVFRSTEIKYLDSNNTFYIEIE